MIVKVQLPISWTPEEKPMALVYNEDGSIYVQIDITPELRAEMNGSVKQFFEADCDGKTIRFKAPAPWQDW